MIHAGGALRRALPWVALVGFAAAPALDHSVLLRPIEDPDTFWHVRAGEYLWRTHHFVGEEPWSRFSTRPWVLHEWLAQLGIAAASRLGGLTALAWLQAGVTILLVFLLYGLARRLGATVLIAGLTADAGWLGAGASLALRPQMISFMFLAVATAAALRTAHDHRPRWWLAPLTWLWACSHGLWFVGVLVGSAAVVGLALERVATRRDLVRLALVQLAAAGAACLTPVGPRLLIAAWEIRGYGARIQEWQPPNLFSGPLAACAALAGVIVLLWTRGRRRPSWTHLLLWLSALAWTLAYQRTVALGAVIFALLAADTVASTSTARSQPGLLREAGVLLVGCLAFAVVGGAVDHGDLGRPAPTMPQLETALEALPDGTAIYNDYGIGGWLLWAHPELAPVIDGRTEVYDLAYVNRYFDSYQAFPGWQRTVADSGARTALLTRGSALAAGLADQLKWGELAHDGNYVLLRAP